MHPSVISKIMWDIFILAALCGIILLYVPGLLINKALHFDTLLSFVMSPVTSCFLITLVGIALYFIPLEFNGIVLFLVILCISFIVFVISPFISKSNNGVVAVTSTGMLSRIPRSMTRFSMKGLQSIASNWGILLIYAIFGIIATIYMFVGNIEFLNSASGLFVEDANFNAISSISQQAVFSVISVFAANDASEAVVVFQSLWQIIPAIISNMTGFDFVLCFNATLAVFVAFIIPFGIFGLLGIVFSRNRLLVILGAVFSLSYGAFPWRMVLLPEQIGPLVSLTFVPYVFIAILGLTIQGSQRSSKLVYLFLLLATLISLICSFPHIVFAILIICLPYLISRYFCWVNDFGKFENAFLAKLLGTIACLSACFLVWVIFCNIPITVTASISESTIDGGIVTAVLDVIFLGLVPGAGYQIVLGAISLCGVFIMMSVKWYRWIVATWALSGVLFLLSALLPAQNLLYTFGFWYVNSSILAAFVCLFSIPLACIFSETVIRALSNAFCSFAAKNHPKLMLCFIGCLFTAIFLVSNTLVHSTTYNDGVEYENSISIIKNDISASYVFVNESQIFVDTTDTNQDPESDET